MPFQIVTQPMKRSNMQINLTFDEMSQIILAHVRTRMNVVANTVDIPCNYTKHRTDFCVVSTAPKEDPKVQQVAPQEKIEAPDFP